MPRKKMTRKTRTRKMRVAKLSKSVTVISRMYGLLIQALDAGRAESLELQRRMTKLEDRLGLKWIPDFHYDGDYTAR